MERKIWIAEISDTNYPRITNIQYPRILIGKIVSAYKNTSPEEYVALINSGLVTNSAVTNNASKLAQKHPLKSRTDLLNAYNRKIVFKHSDPIRDLKETLETQGYVVDTFGAERLYTIYVVNLDSSKHAHRSPWVYVGQTQRSPEERLRVHLAGGQLASPTVTKFGLSLNLELYENLPQTHFLKDALALEAATKNNLEQQGYTVSGGH